MSTNNQSIKREFFSTYQQFISEIPNKSIIPTSDLDLVVENRDSENEKYSIPITAFKYLTNTQLDILKKISERLDN